MIERRRGLLIALRALQKQAFTTSAVAFAGNTPALSSFLEQCSLALGDAADALDPEGEAPPPQPSAPLGQDSARWMVVRRRETETPEVYEFHQEHAARCFHDRAQEQWSDCYLLRVVAHGKREGEAPQPSAPTCEGGVSVRWCPRCGTCTCPYDDDRGFDDDNDGVDPECPIHGRSADHEERQADPPPAPEARTMRQRRADFDAGWQARIAATGGLQAPRDNDEDWATYISGELGK